MSFGFVHLHQKYTLKATFDPPRSQVNFFLFHQKQLKFLVLNVLVYFSSMIVWNATNMMIFLTFHFCQIAKDRYDNDDDVYVE